MGIFLFIFAIALDMVVTASFLWVGMAIASKLQGMPSGGYYCSFKELIITVAVATIAGFFSGLIKPFLGWLVSIVVLFYMLNKYTQAGFWENLFIVVISRICAIIFFIALPGFFGR